MRIKSENLYQLRSQIIIEPVNTVYRNEGKLIYTNHVPGKQVNVEPTVLNA